MSLNSITIGNAVSSIGTNPFGHCSGLEQIVVDDDNVVFDSRENCNAIIETASNTLRFGCKNTIIPNSICAIARHAFFFNSSVTSIAIPGSVVSIDHDVFNGCKLEQIVVDAGNTVFDSRENCNAIIETASNTLFVGGSLTIIPNTVTSIRTGAFYHRDNLTSIVIPNSVTSIGNAVFESCTSLSSVTIGKHVVSIGDRSFYHCNNLEVITILSETPPSLGNNYQYVFSYVNKSIPVYVPCGTINSYQTASGWSEFTNYQELECPSYEITATANPTNGGTITGSGTYTQGATCTLTATPNSGYTFVNWTESGETVSTNATYSFEVTGARSLVANFMTQGPITNHWTPNQTFENTMDGIGIVLIDGVEQLSAALELGIFCGEDCRGSILPEQEDDHWFYYFSMGGVTGETFTFRLYNHASQQELELTCFNEVQFEANAFLGDWDEPYEFLFSNNVLVTVSIDPEGAGEVTGAGEYPHGTTATLSATANTGFAFRDWSINGETVSTEPTLTLTVETPILVTANLLS